MASPVCLKWDSAPSRTAVGTVPEVGVTWGEPHHEPPLLGVRGARAQALASKPMLDVPTPLVFYFYETNDMADTMKGLWRAQDLARRLLYFPDTGGWLRTRRSTGVRGGRRDEVWVTVRP
jgi:hypothetical protein